MVRFLKKCGFDMRLVSVLYLKKAAGEEVTEDARKEVPADEYEMEYKDLLDVYNVVKENSPMLSRKNLMELFKVDRKDVSKDKEKEMASSSKDTAKDTPRSYDPKVVSASVAHFARHIKKDKHKMNQI